MKTNRQTILTRALLLASRLPLVGGYIARGIVQARYDAAFQGWGERSWIFQSLQDAWIEIDAMTRMELQRIHDALIENSPIVQKIRNLKIQFSVGASGLKVIPESSDEGYNDARTVSWENWWARPERGSDISGAQLTRVWAGLLFDKGEIFVNLTQEEIAQGLRKVIVPRTQTIDAHRVKTPTGMTRDEKTGFPIVDGIVINPDTGARVAYFVRKTNFFTTQFVGIQTTTEDFDRIEAWQPGKGGLIHKFKQRRPGQMRGLPDGTSAFNLVRDNMDLHKYEMQAAKLASQIANVETNPSGELDALMNRKSRLLINTQNAAGTAVVKNAWADYRVSVGGVNIGMKAGDKLDQFMIKRPTVATQDYWDLHITFICIGYNVPKMLVMPYSLQGTVTRADLDICTAAFREDFELIRELCEAVYAWQGEWDLKFNTNFTGAKRLSALQQGRTENQSELIARAHDSKWVMDGKSPIDPHVCLIRPPRAPNVDIGYTAKALEIELRLGTRTMQRVYADQNLDWRVEMRNIAEYLQYVDKLAKEFGITPGQITSLAVEQAIEDPTSKPDKPEGTGKTDEASPLALSKEVVFQ